MNIRIITEQNGMFSTHYNFGLTKTAVKRNENKEKDKQKKSKYLNDIQCSGVWQYDT